MKVLSEYEHSSLFGAEFIDNRFKSKSIFLIIQEKNKFEIKHD